MKTKTRYHEITEGYFSAAQWTLDPKPGSGPYVADPLSVNAEVWNETERTVIRDFERMVGKILGPDLMSEIDMDDQSVGHYLWLESNGHGVGFWDTDPIEFHEDHRLGARIRDALSFAASHAGESGLTWEDVKPV